METFSEKEIAFLTTHHVETIETATLGRTVIRQRRIMEEVRDLRQLGCPQSLFFRVLEQRAKQLGRAWVEFRNSQRSAAPVPTGESDLASAVEAAKLF